MTRRYFCTLFDSSYLLKGLAMISSLNLFCPGMRIYVLCMDEQTKCILDCLDLPFIKCITLAEVENEDLLKAKADRGVAEYCWTLSSCFTWYMMQKQPEIDLITYLDADLLFYSDVRPLFDEIGDASISIVEHRFTPRLRDRAVNGRFCVQWVSFRRNDEGMECLERWRNQCIDWCYYRLEDGKMGDQKYLDEWPERYLGCHIIENLGAGVAPWNYSQYTFTTRGGQVFVDGVPVIFYHFHQFQMLQNSQFDRLSSIYSSEKIEPQEIYEIYEATLQKLLSEIRVLVPEFNAGIKPAFKVRRLRWVQNLIPHPVKIIIKKLIRYKI